MPDVSLIETIQESTPVTQTQSVVIEDDVTKYSNDGLRQRHRHQQQVSTTSSMTNNNDTRKQSQTWRRMILLCLAITVHNFPGKVFIVRCM